MVIFLRPNEKAHLQATICGSADGLSLWTAAPSGRFRYALSAKSGIVSGNSTDIYQGSYRNHSFQAMNLSRIDPVICHGDSRQPSRILSCCSPCFSSHNFHAATIHALHLPLQKGYHIGRQQSMILFCQQNSKNLCNTKSPTLDTASESDRLWSEQKSIC